ncbi:MAG: class I SAM-dependent methyltransferase [Acidobacteriaceae bacterium]
MTSASASPLTGLVNFDRLARPYRWLEYLSFGRALERCRFALLPELASAGKRTAPSRVLLYGDGDGRFLQRLLTVYPALEVDAVDSSAAMLRTAAARLSPDARARVRFHHDDALRFTPPPAAGTGGDAGYDLVITHFFLDCFNDNELHRLLDRLLDRPLDRVGPHLAPDARWLVSEFAIPNRPLPALAARALIRLLYIAFRILTGLRANHLPDYAAVLAQHGFILSRRKTLLGGLLQSELWLRSTP